MLRGASPYVFLGPADYDSQWPGDRPMAITWRLRCRYVDRSVDGFPCAAVVLVDREVG